jgi:hypothetical protein
MVIHFVSSKCEREAWDNDRKQAFEKTKKREKKRGPNNSKTKNGNVFDVVWMQTQMNNPAPTMAILLGSSPRSKKPSLETRTMGRGGEQADRTSRIKGCHLVMTCSLPGISGMIG